MCLLRYFRQTNQLTLTFVLRERDLSLPTLLLKEEISLYKKLWDSFVYGEKVDKSDKILLYDVFVRYYKGGFAVPNANLKGEQKTSKSNIDSDQSI